MDIDGYLARLQLDRSCAPTLDWLFAAHRAQREVRLSCPADFFAALADVFGLTLDDLDAGDRARLWRDAQTGQAAYEASQLEIPTGMAEHVPH